MTTILVTGFGPFPGMPFNPTATLVERIARTRRTHRAHAALATHIFPTSYAAVDRDLPRLLAKHRPDALLMFGVAGRARGMRIERRARNARTILPDAGPGPRAILPDAGSGLRAILPDAAGTGPGRRDIVTDAARMVPGRRAIVPDAAGTRLERRGPGARAIVAEAAGAGPGRRAIATGAGARRAIATGAGAKRAGATGAGARRAAPAGVVQLPAPVHRLLAAARAARCPASLSQDAGRYVCNHLAWRAAEAVAAGHGPRLAAFVHVPQVRRPARPRRAKSRHLNLDDLVRAGERLLIEMIAAARR